MNAKKTPTKLRAEKNEAEKQKRNIAKDWKKLTSGLTGEQIGSASSNKDLPIMSFDPHDSASIEWLRQKGKLDEELIDLLWKADEHKLARYRENVAAFEEAFGDEIFYYPNGSRKLMLAEAKAADVNKRKTSGSGTGTKAENRVNLIRHFATEIKLKQPLVEHSTIAANIRKKLIALDNGEHVEGKNKTEYEKAFGELPKKCEKGKETIGRYILDIVPKRDYNKKTPSE
jgi:hypothetical protein